MVLLVALAQRVLLWFSYPPVTFHDTGGYRRLADTILGGWNFYDGTRIPGYPQWMAWIGADRQVYLSQLALGLAMTLTFFFIGWQAARSPAFGAVVALAHTLNLGQLFFEADLLSETLATFWLLLALACVGLALQWKGWRLAGLAGSRFVFRAGRDNPHPLPVHAVLDRAIPGAGAAPRRVIRIPFRGRRLH